MSSPGRPLALTRRHADDLPVEQVAKVEPRLRIFQGTCACAWLPEARHG
ncbi:hypothetical protein ACN469_41580 [Corallococcus terminator]